MTQAQASLARILSGEYTPDQGAISFQFEDGSILHKMTSPYGSRWRALDGNGRMADLTETEVAR